MLAHPHKPAPPQMQLQPMQRQAHPNHQHHHHHQALPGQQQQQPMRVSNSSEQINYYTPGAMGEQYNSMGPQQVELQHQQSAMMPNNQQPGARFLGQAERQPPPPPPPPQQQQQQLARGQPANQMVAQQYQAGAHHLGPAQGVPASSYQQQQQPPPPHHQHHTQTGAYANGEPQMQLPVPHAPGQLGPNAAARAGPQAKRPSYLQRQQQQQQLQQQIPVRHPQANHQQPPSMDPLQQQQQQQQRAASCARPQQPITSSHHHHHQSQQHHQHHFNSSVNIQNNNNNSNSNNQVQQQQQQQQQISSSHQGHLMGGDLIQAEQFVSQSPTLLQQQLNRQRPPTGQQQHPLQPHHQPHQHQHQHQFAETRAGPPPHLQHGGRQRPAQEEPLDHYQQQQLEGAHMKMVPQHADATAAAYAYQTGAVESSSRMAPAMHKQRASAAAAMTPNQARQQQRQQQQQVIAAPLGQQLDTSQGQHQFSCNPTPPLTPNAAGPPASLVMAPRNLAGQQQQQPDDWPAGYQQQQLNGGLANYAEPQAPAGPAQVQVKHRSGGLPKMQQHLAPSQQQAAPLVQYHQATNTSQQQQLNSQLIEQQQQVAPISKPMGQPEQQIRLTLPLRDAVLAGPFRLEHGVQFTTKTFHLRPQLYESLNKATIQQQQQTGAVIQELQFRAYLTSGPSPPPPPPPPANLNNGESLLAPHGQQNSRTSPLATSNACQWPELFQVSCNQQLVHLDRTNTGATPRGAVTHRAADMFPYCQPGDNLLELQVNDCYCSHEFILELVDRPTLKAFMNSCFKSRLLSADSCLAKLRALFGGPNFLCQLPAVSIMNEYVSELVQQPSGQQTEQTRAKISLRCPLSGRRMRTPTRGPNCKHLQCFDLENFLLANRDRTRWSCPLCGQHIPFNMLELDQHQMGICQSMACVASTDEILISALGQWQAYHNQTPSAQTQVPVAPQQHQQHQLQPAYNNGQPPASATARANGTFHPQAPLNTTSGAPVAAPSASPGTAMRPVAASAPPARTHQAPGSPALWDQQSQQQYSHPVSPPTSGVRRPPSTLAQPQSNGRRSAGLAGGPPPKRAYASPAPYSSPTQAGPPSFIGDPSATTNEADLSPLAAMERTIIHHEQQMGPPPFDANILTSSPLRSAQSGGGGGGAHQSPSSAGFSSLHHHQSPPEMLPSQQQQQTQAAPSPARQVPASPQQATRSPIQQTGVHATSISTPATPLVLGAPETPATPGNAAAHQMQSQSQSQQQQPQSAPPPHTTAVDHQPLSNGSASVASITSTSTLTPSGQSLGSVGMGGDSRCNTAPLQNNLGSLDDLVVLPSSSGQLGGSSPYSKQQLMSSHQTSGHEQLGQPGPFCVDHDKSEILMSKLMMDADRERQSGELALALEEAEWKQQLDRGKSEHLANFLNEPLMNKNKQQHQQHQHQHQHLDPLNRRLSHGRQLLSHEPSSEHDGANKMLSGGLNPSDDEGANLHSPASPSHKQHHLDHLNHLGSSQHHLHHHHQHLHEHLDLHHGQQSESHPQFPLDSYANYLDSNGADDGAGLPPDDSILDLFER